MKPRNVFWSENDLRFLPIQESLAGGVVPIEEALRLQAVGESGEVFVNLHLALTKVSKQ